MRTPTAHPEAGDALAIHLDLDGDTVAAADIEVGFLHQGLEKQFEATTYEGGIDVAARIHTAGPRSYQASASVLGYVSACEELFMVVPPARARTLRVIFAELTRVAEHLEALRLQARVAGAEALAGRITQHLRLVEDSTAELLGEPGAGPLFRIGGLRCDVRESALGSLAAVLDGLPEFLRGLLSDSHLMRLFALRLRGVGAVSGEDALGYGLTGPNLRASGVSYDVRRARPECGYEAYDFSIPVQRAGDAWSRFAQRVEECRESLRIIAQARDHTRPGPVALEDTGPHGTTAVTRETAPQGAPGEDGEDRENGEEAPHSAATGSHPLRGQEICASVEAPTGELGYFIVAADAERPYRVRVRTPSFYHAAALEHVLAGERVDDVPLVVASFGLVAGEIDR